MLSKKKLKWKRMILFNKMSMMMTVDLLSMLLVLTKPRNSDPSQNEVATPETNQSLRRGLLHLELFVLHFRSKQFI